MLGESSILCQSGFFRKPFHFGWRKRHSHRGEEEADTDLTNKMYLNQVSIPVRDVSNKRIQMAVVQITQC